MNNDEEVQDDLERPSFQFYPGDWLHDPALRMSSLPARGLWTDMLCYMHQGNPYGYLKVRGKVILPDNLARMVGESIETVNALLCELEENEVFSRDEEGCIYSRRLVKDEQIRQSRAAGGFKGGNPALLKAQKDNQVQQERLTIEDNLTANLGLTPSSSSSSSSSKRKRTQQYYDDEFEEWWSRYPHPPIDDKPRARKNYATTRSKVDKETLWRATDIYASTRKGEDRQFNIRAANFVGRDKRYEAYLEPIAVDKVDFAPVQQPKSAAVSELERLLAEGDANG